MSQGETKGVPLLDLQRQFASIHGEVQAAVARVLESQRFILGSEVDEFERAVAEYCGVEFAVGCASGSDALLLALMALEVGPGDQVICPTYTFFATASSIWRLGAQPVFVDIDPITYNIDPGSVARAAAGCSQLRAILPVHLFGRCADTEALRSIAADAGVPLVHDAAQAIGARDTSGRRTGESGELCCFSFFPSKNLGGYGDGGLVTTADASLAERLRALRTHGAERKYYHERVGLNSRLDALQAAILGVKLPHLDTWDNGRNRNADHLDARFRDAGAANSASPLEDGGLPLRFPERPSPPARHVINQYVVRVPAERRDPLRAHLEERSIGSAIYYPLPLHRQACFASLGYAEGSLPIAETASLETLALPIFPELSADELDRIADEVIDFLRS